MRVELPIVSFISAVLVLMPLPWHWRAHHVATTALIIWLALCNIIRGANSIIWSGNTVEKFELWCDITTNVQTGANIGIPASVLCINRYLAQIVSPNHEIFNKHNKRQRMRLDIGMCIILPIVFTPLHYVVQPFRFALYEDIGCLPSTYPSVATLFIVTLPPVLLSFAGMVYAGVALRWLIQRRDQLMFLQASQSRLARDRYIRLVVLCIVEMVVCSTISFFLLIISTEPGFLPWNSWEYIHEDSMIVHKYARESMSESFWISQLLMWYFVPIASVVFFTFFGFAPESLLEYKNGFHWIKMRILSNRPGQASALAITSHEGTTVSNSSMVIHGCVNGPEIATTEYGLESLANNLPSAYTSSPPTSTSYSCT